MKQIAYTGSARRELRKLPEVIQAQVKADLAAYAASGAGDVAKVKSREGAWRLRSGDYRVIFLVDAATLTVEAVAHRRDIYR